LDVMTEIPGLKSDVYTIAPMKTTTFKVWCDLETDGGGWNVVSINGDLTQETCRHRLKSDAPSCGTSPSLTTDWQLAGSLMNQITFHYILLNAYETPGTFYAATRLHLSSGRTVNTGAMTVTPSAINNSPVTCDPAFDDLTARTKVGVSVDGYTVW